jgi:hypothetical protein
VKGGRLALDTLVHKATRSDEVVSLKDLAVSGVGAVVSESSGSTVSSGTDDSATVIAVKLHE